MCVLTVRHTSAVILQTVNKNRFIVERLALLCHKSHYIPRINNGSKVRINKLEGWTRRVESRDTRFATCMDTGDVNLHLHYVQKDEMANRVLEEEQRWKLDKERPTVQRLLKRLRIQQDEVDGACSTHGEIRNEYQVLIGDTGGGGGRPLR